MMKKIVLTPDFISSFLWYMVYKLYAKIFNNNKITNCWKIVVDEHGETSPSETN